MNTLSQFNPLTIRSKSVRSKAYFALILVCFFWGTTWIASREGVQHMPAIQLAGIRQFLGGLCYLVFFMWKGARWPRGKEWYPILVLSFLNFMLSNALSTWGVKYISAGLGSIIGAIFPIWILFIGFFIASDKIKPQSIAGLVLGLAGICIVFHEHLGDFIIPEFRLGIFLSVASTWSWAFGTLYTKQQAAFFNPYFSLGLQMLISGTVLMGGSYGMGAFTPFTEIPWQSWTAILYLVIFGSVISFIAYLYALQNLPTEQASLYAYINPIVAVLLGFMLFDEKLTLSIGLGVLVTLCGVYLVRKSSLRIR